jgi:outer membrane protein OmpA-like peptidoglycan-associated protein
MAFRATGPGQIEIDPRYAGAGILRALLYNFDFDDAHVTALKREHVDFLRARALPLLAGDRGRIWLQGQASQVGNRAYNLDLSRRRVNRVVVFLNTNGVASGSIQPDAVGEDSSTSTVADDPRDRSVALSSCSGNATTPRHQHAFRRRRP